MQKPSIVTEITYHQRKTTGRGDARSKRRQGLVPAVVFGGGEKPVHITIDIREINKMIEQGGVRTKIFKLKSDEKPELRVLTKDIQFHPVKDVVEHVDFLRVDDKTEIRVEIKVKVINEELSPGIKLGGVVNLVRHTIELICQAGSIPQELVIDMEGLAIGDSVHISSIKLPSGVRPVIGDRDFTVATIASVASAATEGATIETTKEEDTNTPEEAPGK